ncbi:MAG: PLP-dependent aminotransferase family protein [Lachnospiraceae bacterium]|nr:PLP-dependent aminotransferase family protein [Lachnospiraceae bacterium]
MELIIPLDNQGSTPMYQQIYQYMKQEIRQGNLKAGVRLPSTRVLADHLKVSRSTTQMAYEQLLSEGYIEAVPCKGYFVSAIEALVEVREQPAGQFVTQEVAGQEGFVVDFSPRGIDLDSFPFNTWRKISKNILVDDNKALFLNGDPQGEYALREAIRSYLHSARGVRCSADQIIVGAGNEYLLMLLSLVLGPNRVIAMENPTYKQAYRVFISQGCQVVPVEMDKHGMDVRRLREAGNPENRTAAPYGLPEQEILMKEKECRLQPDTAYIMPSHQHPMGIVMPVKRRQELLAWAYEEEERYLIEDDYDSEFRYKGKPIPALQGMDHGGRVIYIGTFSQSIAPAIRVGFIVLPMQLLAKYKEKAGFYSSTVSRIDQNILYQFLTEGHYERHLNRMRSVYKGKHDCLMGELKEFEAKFDIAGEHAGLHVLLTHRKGMREQELEQKAAAAGVKVYGLSRYFIHPEHNQYPSTVVLGYANLTEEEIREGCRRLKEAWEL